MARQQNFKTLSFFIIFLTVSANQARDSTVVEISQGKLRGVISQSRHGRDYFAFMGIPYVDQPERYEPPSFDPPKPWSGIRDATVQGPMCIQYNVVTDHVKGREDCLYLSVFTKQLNGSLPVMVYIHGGGFQWGTGHIQGPRYLMDEEVVVVTFNYRLGSFGFLSTGDEVIQGNMGMKDQVAALKWVQRNIKTFGGDPKRVTIFGESAGGAAASLLLLSKMSQGLFRNAISQSGAALNPWACLKNPRYHMKELADKVGCPSENSYDLKDCLKSKNSHELVAHSYARWHLDPTVPFGPVVEKLRSGQTDADVFLSESPYKILSEGTFQKLPWIVGITEDEGVYFHSSSILKEQHLQNDVNSDWNRVAPFSLTFYDDPATSKEELSLIASEIKRFYFNGSKVDESTRQALTDLYSDRYFVHGIRTTAKMAALQGALVYPYIFEYEGKFSFLQQRGFKKPMGVTHKDDIHYLFDKHAPDPAPGPDTEFSENFVKLWVAFAHSSKPTPSWGSIKDWKPISMEEAKSEKPFEWFIIDNVTAIIQEPFTDRMNFWDYILRRHPALSYPKEANSVYKHQEL